MVNVKSVLSLGALASMAAAHPTNSQAELDAEILARRSYLDSVIPEGLGSLNKCYETIKNRGYEAAAVKRRSAIVKAKRDAIKLAKRADAQTFWNNIEMTPEDQANYDHVLNTSHRQNSSMYNLGTTESMLFANSTVTLVPETIQGPYWIAGEQIRKNVTEGQAGIPITMDIQIYDIQTCLPVPNVYIDIWHCNATGVYSGVQVNGNGNADVAENLNATFLRGVQPTDPNGVAAFDSIMPGHYAHRAPHMHVLLHTNIEVFANGTYWANASTSGGRVQHTGQIFFDQDLIYDVDKVYPYSTNTIPLYANDADQVLTNETYDDSDPMANYVYLGDELADGMLMWTAIGVNMYTNYNVTPNAIYTEQGGRMVNSDLHQAIDFDNVIADGGYN